ncbi:hypothetical protein [Jatrophihabitans sp.]|uniref:hypothetical protein n=1 Tax=Jatrophihabitans sp. TaxID=1932789 RepID=UPI0030C66A76|nr:hypothetical protein [Jatrophihabitans sp.]
MSLLDPGIYREVAPLAQRMVGLDPATLVRLRHRDHRLTALVRTPFAVLAARAITVPSSAHTDVTVRGDELLAWLDGGQQPQPRDADWHWGLPPERGWQRLEQVPDEVVRGLVRSGALALKEAAEREGVPGAQPRAEVADALLDSVVLTVSGATALQAAVTLRTVSALTRLGFLARGSHAAVDVAGRWVRVAGSYGSVFAETAPLGLGILR